MSINVVVSSTAAGVSVSGGTSVAITVSGSTAAAVTVGGGIGPAGFLINPGTATNAFGTFQLTAGDGITISTSAAQFQISSYGTTAVSSFAPVQSVAGRTGSVVLQASDVTAGTFAVARIPTISYTALSNVPATFSPSAHTHSTSDVMSFTAAAAAAAPVQSVAGRSGAVSLAVADISGLAAVASSGSYTSLQNVPATFAPSAHTHSTADITGITGSFAAAGHTHDAAAITSGVLELARIPTIGFTALAGVPSTFSPQAHTHSTADVVGLTASFSQVGHTHDATAIASGVLELARIPTIGYTALSGVPTSFSPSVHTHSTADVVGLTASFSQLGHVHSTADITGYSSLPAQGGKAGPLVTDGTAATWTTRYSVVDPVLVQGSGMTLTRDTSAGSITVAFAGGTSGVSVSSATPQPLGTAAAGSSGDASRSDHVHLMPSAADVGAAATGHSHPYVQVLNGLTGTLTIAGGSGVTVSTASSSITIAAAGGGLSWSAVPASATATGTAGSISYDNANGFFYVATATDTWKRAALASWETDAFASSVVFLMHADGTLADSSTYARTVTPVGSPTSTGTPRYGSGALSFNGSGDYFTVPSASSLDLGSNYTLEAWIYPNSSTLSGGVLHRGRYSTASTSWDGMTASIRGLSTFMRFYFRVTNNSDEQSVDVSQTYFPANTWTHVAMVRSGTSGYVFAGGQLVGTISSLGAPVASTHPLYIGTWEYNVSGTSTFAGYWNGRIDEIRITTAARYTSAFTPRTAAFPNP